MAKDLYPGQGSKGTGSSKNPDTVNSLSATVKVPNFAVHVCHLNQVNQEVSLKWLLERLLEAQSATATDPA